MNKLEQSRITFNEQASTYDQSVYGEHARSLYPFLLQNIIQTSVIDVLDLGCGSGALLKQVYAEDHTRSLYGVDVSEEMIKVAQKRLKDHAQLQIGDAHDLPYPDHKFDLVYCNDSFHHYSNPIKVIQEMNRVLRPEGIFLIGETYQGNITRWIMNLYFHFCKTGDVHMYSKKEFYSLLEPNFDQLSYEVINKRSCIIKAVKKTEFE